MKIRNMIAALGISAAAAAVLSVSASAADRFGAYIGFQNNEYGFRNSWGDSGFGAETGYHDKFIVWGRDDDPDKTFPAYADRYDYDIGAYALDADYNDITVDRNGTYTVSASEIDWTVDGASDFNMIFISTDAPFDAKITCTEAKIIVDGAVVKTVKNPKRAEFGAYLDFTIVNKWDEAVGGYGLAYPTKSLSVEFTIDGFPEPPTEPTFSVNGGTFTEEQNVIITAPTEGAIIYYTLDGSEPTESSVRYTAPVSIAETKTLKAIAVKDGKKSKTASADFIINANKPENPREGYFSTGESSIFSAPVDTIVSEKTDIKNQRYNIRFVKKVTLESLNGKSKAVFKISNGVTEKSVSTSNYYTALTVDEKNVPSGDGCAFLVYTIADVSENVNLTASGITLE